MQLKPKSRALSAAERQRRSRARKAAAATAEELIVALMEAEKRGRATVFNTLIETLSTQGDHVGLRRLASVLASRYPGEVPDFTRVSAPPPKPPQDRDIGARLRAARKA